MRREQDPNDGRKQILHLTLENSLIHDAIEPLRRDVAVVLENFDADQLTAITEFLKHSTELINRHAALLRAKAISATGGISTTEVTLSSTKNYRR